MLDPNAMLRTDIEMANATQQRIEFLFKQTGASGEQVTAFSNMTPGQTQQMMQLLQEF
jgi:hypothetical protein